MRILLLLLLAFVGCTRTPTTHGPLPHEVYVWQRHWTPAVRIGIERAAPSVAGFDVLIGEVGMQDGDVHVVLAQTDYAALAQTGKPVALGLRIATYSGPFSPQSKLLRAATDTLRSALSQASTAGLRVTELQIDFDCPSARLAGYAVWVRELQAAFPQTPLAITALPDWLKQRDFAPLATAAGRFVLQVHSVPGAPGTAPVLCDPVAARRAITLAGRLRIPFRVALPTYSCELLTDATGRVTGVHAEEAPTPRSGGSIVLRANAAELAALVREWESSRPASLEGVIWYRLPVESDRLNWRWPTLAAIIAGRTPQPQGKLIFEPADSGVENAVLENKGDADWALPAELLVPGDTVAADGVNGFRLESEFHGAPRLRGMEGRILPPGGRLVCGWIRRNPSTEVAAQNP
ncbi:MAG: DUF3142 domain-containing protein [Chthoniobacter sp.]|uniref:DUF3142 domain-containing protein n=1 Tax=Chthoniobacter sp. TaxID=2510640 RepID=UPI0032A68C47